MFMSRHYVLVLKFAKTSLERIDNENILMAEAGEVDQLLKFIVCVMIRITTMG